MKKQNPKPTKKTQNKWQGRHAAAAAPATIISPHQQVQLAKLDGAEHHMQVVLGNLRSSLQTMWLQHVAGPHAIPTLEKSAKVLGLVAKGDIQGGWDNAKLQAAVDSLLKGFLQEKANESIPKSDVRYAGNCHTEVHTGCYQGEDGGKMQFQMLSILAAPNQGKDGGMAYSMIHLHKEKDVAAREDKILFHQFRTDANGKTTCSFLSKNVPDAILVSSRCASANDVLAAYHTKPNNGDILDHIRNPALVSMVYYKLLQDHMAAKQNCGVKGFTPLQRSPHGNLMWMYAVQATDGTVNFLLCRKGSLDWHRAMAAAKAGKEVKQPPMIKMRDTFASDDGTRKNISMANEYADRHVGPAWSQYARARSIYHGKMKQIAEGNKVLMDESAREYAKYMNMKGSRMQSWMALSHLSRWMHWYEQNKMPVKEVDRAVLHWTYRVCTRSMDEMDHFAIEFSRLDDFSHSKDNKNVVLQIVQTALLHCLDHRTGPHLGEHHKGKWQEDAIHKAIQTACEDHLAEDKKNALPRTFVYKKDSCTVRVRRKQVEVDETTCKRLQREEPAAIAARSVCKDWAYEIDVSFANEAENANGFVAVVHIAVPSRPVCRENAETTIKEGKDVARVDPGRKEETKAKLVLVKALASGKNVDLHQIIERVACMQMDCIKADGRFRSSVANVLWCNANIAHIQNSEGYNNSYIWAQVTAGWSIQNGMGKEPTFISLQTKYSLTISNIRESLKHRSGVEALRNAEALHAARITAVAGLKMNAHRGDPTGEAQNHPHAATGVTRASSVELLKKSEEKERDAAPASRQAVPLAAGGFGGLKIEQVIGAASRVFS